MIYHKSNDTNNHINSAHMSNDDRLRNHFAPSSGRLERRLRCLRAARNLQFLVSLGTTYDECKSAILYSKILSIDNPISILVLR